MVKFFKIIGRYMMSLLTLIVGGVVLLVISVLGIVFSPLVAIFFAMDYNKFETEDDEESEDNNCVDMDITIENNNKINANKKIKLNHFSSINKSNSSRNDKYLSIRANSIYISNDNQNKKVPNRNNKGKEALIKLFRK